MKVDEKLQKYTGHVIQHPKQILQVGEGRGSGGTWTPGL